MPVVETPVKPEEPAGGGTIGGGGPRKGYGGSGRDGGRQGGRDAGGWSVPPYTYRTGMWVALTGIVMLFAAFTSAMVVRKGLSNDWVRTTLPHILYLNTVVLILSSVTLELSRRALTRGLGERFRAWLYATLALGLAFVAGQLIAWGELAKRGVYLSTNPSSSFFYLLTGAHGLHLLGGILALGYVAAKAPSIAAGRKKRTAVDVSALYWHFMDGLWIYILILFFVRL
jgi:cytochrome c oxidase subunit III